MDASTNNNPIVLISDKRQTKFIFGMIAFTLVMAFGSVYYTMDVASVATDIGVVKELENIKYNQQLYLALAAKLDSTQEELLRIQKARMDTAALNRAEYVKRQHRADSIIAYETMTRAQDEKIRALQIKELHPITPKCKTGND